MERKGEGGTLKYNTNSSKVGKKMSYAGILQGEECLPLEKL